MFQPGEIVHAAFPFTNLTTAKRRPCLVLARCESLDDCIVAFITSSGASRQSVNAVALDPSHPQWQRTGLKRPSLIRVDKLATLHLSVISGGIGILPNDVMKLVRDKLQVLLCQT